ncbi:MAG: Ig-like domain-containing protein, partial [Anaeromyxobacteraceae bacterium]|nr:Ig-like domain-containing protein [Anaeromyxobacteraceae bacterium]
MIDPGERHRARPSRSTLATLLALLAAACGGGAPPAPRLASIAVTPSPVSLPKGRSIGLTATGTLTDGSTADLSTSVTWTSAAPGTASVSGAGVLFAAAVGDTTVTAAQGGVVSPEVPVSVTAPVLVSIVLEPPSATIPKGTAAAFTATGTSSDGGTAALSDGVTWHSSDPSVATVAGGIAAAVGVGQTEITASSGGTTSAPALLTVGPATILSILVTPGDPVIAIGATLRLTATATFSDGTEADVTTSAAWASTDAAVAAVEVATGVATGVAHGHTEVT